MSVYLSSELRKRLEDVDDSQCAYCHTVAANTGQPMTVDHILPQTQDGTTDFENLCFCCRRCNEFKGGRMTASDTLTGETVVLYHPRRQIWREHFEWDESGTRILGITPTGRATVIALQLNNAVIVTARQRWVNVGWHPPEQERV